MTTDQAASEALLSIGELASKLNRVPHTLRMWEYKNMLPGHLLPIRDARGRRYWTNEQYDGICQWIIDSRIFPGKNLPHMKNKIINN